MSNQESTYESNSTLLSSASVREKPEDKKEYHLISPLSDKPDPFKGENVTAKTWTLLDDYFFNNDVRLTQHHLDSYNHFISFLIPKTIQDFNPLTVKANYNPQLGRYMTEYVLEFGDTYIGTPVIKEPDGETKLMFPSEARWRNLTYAADFFLDVYQKVITYNENGEARVKELPIMEKISLRSIPIMVRSKYCVLSSQTGKSQAELGEGRFDKGGYFIVKGAEKVLVCQERKCENKVLAFHHNKSQSAYSHAAEISSVPSSRSFVKNTHLKLLKKTNYGRSIRVFIQRFKPEKPFPLFVVFRALGVISDKDIMEHILYDVQDPRQREAVQLLQASLEEASTIQSQDMALAFMSNYVSKIPKKQDGPESSEDFRKRYVADLLKTELFPHVGDDFGKKAWFLGYMARRLAEVALYEPEGLKSKKGEGPYDDRDSFVNKRIDTSGTLMATLFRNNFNKLVKDIYNAVEKDLRQGRIDEIHSTVRKKIRANTIESGIRYSLGTGNWGLKTQTSGKKGIAQMLQRMSYLGTVSHLRRVNAPRAERGGKITDPRKLHNTQWGIIDPSETPDGNTVGIVKNMALMTVITIGSDEQPFISVLEEERVLPVLEATPYQMYHQVRVFVNGDLYGCTNNPERLVAKLRTLRRQGVLNIYSSITWLIDRQIILIHTEGGRMCRPLFVVKDNQLVIQPKDFDMFTRGEKHWDDLILEGKIEYIDVQEEDTIMCAMSNADLEANSTKNNSFVRYTHAEINPAMIFGAVVCVVPFPENNQGPRIVYSAAQVKQALGIYATNYRDRMDNPGQILRYPQIPMISTRPSRYVHIRELPAGQNAIVAIMCYTGYNQEDSLIFNQSSIDRGLYNSVYLKTYKDSEKKNQASLEEERFCKPVKYNPNGTLRTAGVKGSYDLLDDNGFVKVGSYVKSGDVIIGKVVPLKNTTDTGPKFKDASTTVGDNTAGVVDWVYVNRDSDGYQFCKVRIRSKRVPGIGDKFCYDDQTRILTKNRGWLHFKDLSKKDFVATLGKNDELEYVNPLELHEYDCKEDLYTVSNEQVDLAVTQNHKMYIRSGKDDEYRLKEASSIIGQKVWYKKNAININKDIQYFTLPGYTTKCGKNGTRVVPEKHFDMDSWMIFLGLWLSEGSLDHRLGRVRVYTHKDRVEKLLLSSCEKLGIHPSKDKTSHRYVLVNKQLFHYLKQFGQSFEKYIPSYVWDLSYRQANLLIDSMICGDGYQCKYASTRSYYTSSRQLADDFQRLCLHAGYSANVTLKREKGEKLSIKGVETERLHDSYVITVLTQECTLEPPVNTGSKKEKEELVPYDGKVYCCTVPSGVVYVERNGKSVWCGNSSRFGQSGRCPLATAGQVRTNRAIFSNCGNTLSNTLPSLVGNNQMATVNRSGYGKKVYCSRGNPQPSFLMGRRFNDQTGIGESLRYGLVPPVMVLHCVASLFICFKNTGSKMKSFSLRKVGSNAKRNSRYYLSSGRYAFYSIRYHT